MLAITLVLTAVILTASATKAWVSSEHIQADLDYSVLQLQNEIESKVSALEQRLVEKIEENHEFAIEEVSGLRSDWDRDRIHTAEHIKKLENMLEQ